MTPLNQRDLRWSKQQLGTSNTTIGSHGCTITCIAMLVGTTPDVVNKELKRVGGYANGNLVIWSKVPVAFPQLTFVKRVNSYNNADVLANLPCLVEVDFDSSPVTFGNHWVLFIGNKRLLDPWTGQNRPTSSYPILKGYSVFKKKSDIIPSIGQAPASPNISSTETPPQPETTPETLPTTTEGTNGSETPPTIVSDDGGDVRPDSVDSTIVESVEPASPLDLDTGAPVVVDRVVFTPPKGLQVDIKGFIAGIIAFCLRVLETIRRAVR